MSTPDHDEQIRKWATNKLFLFGSAYHNMVESSTDGPDEASDEMNRRAREFIDMTVELAAGRIDAPPVDDDWSDVDDEPPTGESGNDGSENR